VFIYYLDKLVDPSGRAVKGVVLRSLACWNCGFEPAGDMYISLLCMLCVFRWRPLIRADHSPRGILPSVACCSVIVKP
jgi:hypothetical protein